MPRRKAAAPRANLGRIEGREGAALLQNAEQQLVQEEAAFTAEEELEEDRERARAKKRRRKAVAARAAEAGAAALVPASEQRHCFGTLTFLSTASARPDELVGAVQLEVDSAANEGAADESAAALLSVRSAAWGGSVHLPVAVAEAVVRLLQTGHLSAAAATDSSSSSSSSSVANGQASSSATCVSGLILSLTERTTADAASWAEDLKQRMWQRQLLAVLQWMQPALDPEQELLLRQQAHEPAADQLLSSPLCSPRKQAAAAGGLLSPDTAEPTSPASPTAAGEAAVAFDAAELYMAVKPTGREPELQQGAVGDALLPQLRHYQRRAALWMINRERGHARGKQQQEQEQQELEQHHQQAPASFAGVKDEEDAAAANGHVDGQVKCCSSNSGSLPLHPLWREVRCSSGGGSSSSSSFYINPWSGAVSLERFPAPPEVRGGILSEEMGLGKTVELLACIASHRYTGPAPDFRTASRHKRAREESTSCVCGATDELGYAGLWVQCDECLTWMHATCVGLRRVPQGEWVCGACLREQAAEEVAAPCGATLVVCPTPILHQWHDEIMRHIRPGALRVAVYEGQPQPGDNASSGRRVMTAADLAQCDIVLTTYDVLRRDVNHCPDTSTEQRFLRRRKRYEVMPTPLTRLCWWRVALDEAQMVESSTAKAAEMALKLQTEHRWCVTGTPLSRGLEDLFGLLAFLQAAPYDTRAWYQRVLQQPYERGSRAARARLLALLKPSLGGLLWRSAKADVADELGLPQQHHHLTHLHLSAIERHFYSRQHQDTIGKARAALSPQVLAAAMQLNAEGDGQGSAAAAAMTTGFDNRPLTDREEQKLLQPLLRLRQACCHPQVGGGGIRAAHGHQRAPMSMGEILEVMITKTKVEAEDQQRILLSSINGIAGLLLLQGKQAEAVAAYRQALAIMEQNKQHIRADALQQLHTLHNLAEVLASAAEQGGIPGVAPTLRDSQLREQAQALRDEYVAESAARLATAEGEMKDVEAAQERVLHNAQLGTGKQELVHGWWAQAVRLFAEHGIHAMQAAADAIKEQIREPDKYLRKQSHNAVSIADRFRDLFGLELILKTELGELQRAEQAALKELAALGEAVANPSQQLIELAATCSRCRADTAVPGRVCRHCKLEELFLRWEGRAFKLYTKAATSGASLTAEAALQYQQEQQQQRVGRGGLGEEQQAEWELGVDGEGGARHQGGVAKTEIVRHPGEAEQALRHLAHQLRLLRPASRAGDAERLGAHKALLLAAAKVQLELLEGGRRLYLKARALGTAQRQKLYSLDELGQSTMRLQLVGPGEWVKPQEEIYKMHPEEIPVRSVELSNEKAVAESDLRDKLGTLRYLLTLRRREEARRAAAGAAAAARAAGAPGSPAAGAQQQARQQQGEQQEDGAGEEQVGVQQQQVGVDAAVVNQDHAGPSSAAGPPGQDQQALPKPSTASSPAAAPPAAAATLGDEEEDLCPVCQDPMGTELVMLPCGHRLHTSCHMAVLDRLPPQPAASRRVNCPTCRTRVLVSEVAFVDIRAAEGKVDPAEDASGVLAAGEAGLRVHGSLGTKLEAVVRRLAYLTRSDASARVLVFSTWKDVLELLSHALHANALPHLYPKGGGKRFEAAVADFRSGHAEALAAEREAAAAAAAGPSKSKHPTANGSSKAAAGVARSTTPRILLLMTKQGANGLNLTEAQHVVLVEPLLDPAVEAQAVGRVDRIGQKRETHVHRFVVSQTIEENVHKLCQARAAAMDLSAAAVKGRAGAKERGTLSILDVAVLLRESGRRLQEAEEDRADGAAGLGVEGAASDAAAPAAAELSPRQRAAAAALARATGQQEVEF